ncbi:MAG: ribonuclease III domain-containing protein [Candidatus Omnitrophota bacterium]|nr:ribonuclease III domain-containing protein [Candidatus Omnitrophota bacterium]
MGINKIDLAALEQTLNYQFKDKNLLLQALTHTTFAYESQKENLNDNQRLEFLGDSILTMITADYLYKKHPECAEGELTHRRSLLVNRDNFAKKAKEVNLSQYLLLGKGEEKLGGRENSTNLSCALEAIIGAVYLDGGFEQAYKFVKLIII